MEQHVVSGIAYSRDEAKVSIRKVKDQPGVSASLFGPLAEADISVDMIVQNISADGFDATSPSRWRARTCARRWKCSTA